VTRSKALSKSFGFFDAPKNQSLTLYGVGLRGWNTTPPADNSIWSANSGKPSQPLNSAAQLAFAYWSRELPLSGWLRPLFSSSGRTSPFGSPRSGFYLRLLAWRSMGLVRRAHRTLHGVVHAVGRFRVAVLVVG
jgi:hypothetical protein